MKRLLLISYLCLLTLYMGAQVPGYMGLKCSIQYQGGLNPQWNNTQYSHVPYLSHNVQIGYVVSRKHEIGLQYTRIDYSSGVGARQGFNNSEDEVVADYRGFTGNNVTAYIKFFRARKGFIAPLGRYYILGVSYENSRDRYHVTSDPNTARIPNTTTVHSHDIALTMGIGRNIIVANRMLISVEGLVNIPFSSAIRAGLSGGYTGMVDHNGNDSGYAYKYFNALDVMLINILQLKIGIGALVF